MSNNSSETKIYLIRHGTIENPQDIVYGRLPGFHLSENGRKQVDELSKILESRRVKFTEVYSSSLERAQETGQILAQTLANGKVQTADELSDTNEPYFEGKPMSVLREVEFDSYKPEFIAKGVESPQEQITRTRKLLAEVLEKHQGETVAFVTHGDPSRFLLWSLVHPDGYLSDTSKLRDDDYLGPAEAVLLRFDQKGEFLDFEHIRRASSDVESQSSKLKEAT